MNDNRWRPGDPVDWDRPGELWTAGGLHAFVVESTGRQTRRTRRAVLGYLDDGPDAWLIVASKGGAPTNPAWVYNLAERLANEDLDRAWDRIAEEAPEYVAYRSRTKRPIPVLRLRREPA